MIFIPRGGTVGGGVIPNCLGYGMGINFEADFVFVLPCEVVTTWTNLLLSNSLLSSCRSSSFLAEAVVRIFLTAPPDRTLSKAVWLKLALILGDLRFFWNIKNDHNFTTKLQIIWLALVFFPRINFGLVSQQIVSSIISYNFKIVDSI